MEVSINAGIANVKNNVVYLDGKRIENCSKVAFELEAGSPIPTVTLNLIGQAVKIHEDEAKVILVVEGRKFRVVEEI